MSINILDILKFIFYRNLFSTKGSDEFTLPFTPPPSSPSRSPKLILPQLISPPSANNRVCVVVDCLHAASACLIEEEYNVLY